MRRRGSYYVIIWLVLTVVSATGGILILRWPVYYQLVKRGVPTEGIVVAKEPDNHWQVRYTYLVGQDRYQGIGVAGAGNPTFTQLSVGDKVLVFYDPDNPEDSHLGNPEYELKSVTMGVVFITVMVPLFFMMALYRRRRQQGG